MRFQVEAGPARRVVVTGTADFNPTTLAGGRPLPDGMWDISVRFDLVGVDLKTRLGVDATTRVRCRPPRSSGPARPPSFRT